MSANLPSVAFQKSSQLLSKEIRVFILIQAFNRSDLFDSNENKTIYPKKGY
jgi:hypothetical protein